MRLRSNRRNSQKPGFCGKNPFGGCPCALRKCRYHAGLIVHGKGTVTRSGGRLSALDSNEPLWRKFSRAPASQILDREPDRSDAASITVTDRENHPLGGAGLPFSMSKHFVLIATLGACGHARTGGSTW